MQSTANQLNQPGDMIEYSIGSVRISLQVTIDHGYTINTWAGPTRVEALCRSYTDERIARSKARHLAVALKNGVSVWQYAAHTVTAEQGVMATADSILTEALQVAMAAPIGAKSDREIAHLQTYVPVDTSNTADRINADWDVRDRQDTATRNQLDADVADIMANSRGFRGTVPQGQHRQVRPTMAGAHLADVTSPQQRAVQAAKDGVVHVGPHTTAATLKALARKGLGQLTYDGGRYRILALTLNSRGLAEVTR